MLVADGHQRSVDRDAGSIELDVAPVQAEELTASHSGVRRDPQSGVKAVVGGGVEERPQLLGSHRLVS